MATGTESLRRPCQASWNVTIKCVRACKGYFLLPSAATAGIRQPSCALGNARGNNDDRSFPWGESCAKGLGSLDGFCWISEKTFGNWRIMLTGRARAS